MIADSASGDGSIPSIRQMDTALGIQGSFHGDDTNDQVTNGNNDRAMGNDRLKPNPEADEVDLSVLRGTRAPRPTAQDKMRLVRDKEGDEDLTALAEIVPGLLDKKSDEIDDHAATSGGSQRNVWGGPTSDGYARAATSPDANIKKTEHDIAAGKTFVHDETGIEITKEQSFEYTKGENVEEKQRMKIMRSGDDDSSYSDEDDVEEATRKLEELDRKREDKENNKNGSETSSLGCRGDGVSPNTTDSGDKNVGKKTGLKKGSSPIELNERTAVNDVAKLSQDKKHRNDSNVALSDNHKPKALSPVVSKENIISKNPSNDYGESDTRHNRSTDAHVLHNYDEDVRPSATNRQDDGEESLPAAVPGMIQSGAASTSGLQSVAGSAVSPHHEVRMPMYLPTFKPATGCTNASDFIVRCFVARLRSGITVVKHGRSRWCKSRLRILHVHSDGRSLSWKPALGEPTSSKRPPKLDLSTCLEVRHAWSPDPLNPLFTGTPILRQKCEAANAHKSFALIFPKRTVDITAVTADQCKVLMEGFSALCFRLQVATLAGRKKKALEGSVTEDDERTTASATLTNNSSANIPSTSPLAIGKGGNLSIPPATNSNYIPEK